MSKNKKCEVKENVFLTEILAKMNKAKKDDMVVVYTTNRESYKKNISSPQGFGVSDLKKKQYDAYKYLLINHDVEANLVNMNDFAVEWKVKRKKIKA